MRDIQSKQRELGVGTIAGIRKEHEEYQRSESIQFQINQILVLFSRGINWIVCYRPILL